MSDNTSTQTSWRNEFEAALLAHEEAAQRFAKEQHEQAIAARTTYINNVIALAKELGIEGDIVERGGEGADRQMPYIVRDGYRFEFEGAKVEKAHHIKGNMYAKPRTPDEGHRVATFKLSVSRVIAHECPLRRCAWKGIPHYETINLDKYGVRVDFDLPESQPDFTLKLAASLRDLDELAANAQDRHAWLIGERYEQDQLDAYREHEKRYLAAETRAWHEWHERYSVAEAAAWSEHCRRYPEACVEDEAVDPNLVFAPQPAKAKLRQRVIIEGSWEWKLLEVFEQMQGIRRADDIVYDDEYDDEY